MAEMGWTARVAAAAGAAAGTGAAQLGLGYGLGVVVWPITDTPDDSVWLGSLGWATWITASATVLGAVIASRLAGGPKPRPVGTSGALRLSGPWRLALAAAAAIGALVAVALIALPARSAVRGDTFSPQVIAAGYAILGVLLGLVVAYWAVVSRPVAANLITTGLWLWALAVSAVVVDLTVHRSSATYLTSWQFAGGTGHLYGTIFWPSAVLTLAAAFVIGIISVAPAAHRGHLGLGAATSGAVGPLLVAAAFFVLAPQLTGDLGPLESAYLIAPYAVIAGLAGSALTVSLTQAVHTRRAARATAHPRALPAAPHSDDDRPFADDSLTAAQAATTQAPAVQTPTGQAPAAQPPAAQAPAGQTRPSSRGGRSVFGKARPTPSARPASDHLTDVDPALTDPDETGAVAAQPRPAPSKGRSISGQGRSENRPTSGQSRSENRPASGKGHGEDRPASGKGHGEDRPTSSQSRSENRPTSGEGRAGHGGARPAHGGTRAASDDGRPTLGKADARPDEAGPGATGMATVPAADPATFPPAPVKQKSKLARFFSRSKVPAQPTADTSPDTAREKAEAATGKPPTGRKTPPSNREATPPSNRGTPPPARETATPTGRGAASPASRGTPPQAAPPAGDAAPTASRETPLPADRGAAPASSRDTSRTPARDAAPTAGREAPRPSAREGAPASRQAPQSPARGAAPPANRQTPPLVGESASSAGRQTPPARDSATPTGRQTPPAARESAPPASRQTPPAARESAPSAGRPAPVGEGALPAGRETPPPAKRPPPAGAPLRPAPAARGGEVGERSNSEAGDPEIAAAARPRGRAKKAASVPEPIRREPEAGDPQSTVTPPPSSPTIAQINPKPSAD